MGIWMEIRCEARTSENGEHRPCPSHHQGCPATLARDTLHGIAQSFRRLEDAAQKAGWLKLRKGWICPSCAASLTS